MFFYISGTASTFYKCDSKGFLVFIWEKVKRLLFPFFLAIPFLLWPRLYFGQAYEDFTRVDNKIENNFFVYCKNILPVMLMKMSWLWFLPVIFIA